MSARRLGRGQPERGPTFDRVGTVTFVSEPFVLPASEYWRQGDLHVALARPMSATGPVPLVVLLDGHTMFLSAAEFARTVSLVTMGTLPPLAVLGVWRDAADPLEYMSTRFRDYTPYEWVLPGPFAEIGRAHV